VAGSEQRSYDPLVDVGTDSGLTGAGESTLSPREQEVLALVAAGLTNTEMAERLRLSVHGVKFHLASIYRKLGVSNRTEAAVHFLRAVPATDHGPEAHAL
jgi:DNA-binding CsgD family transcriptional regulator